MHITPLAPHTRIGIVGAGAVGTSLAMALHQQGFTIAQVYSQTAHSAHALAAAVGAEAVHSCLQLSPRLDIVLLTVPDAMLPHVVDQLRPCVRPSTLYVHCAGSVPLEVLQPLGAHIGVLWPMLSFRKGVVVDTRPAVAFAEAPLRTLPRVLALGQALFHDVRLARADQRAQLHLAAVMANNFVNHMVATASDLAASTGLPHLDHRLFLPMLQALLDRWATEAPADTQSGPARRADLPTLYQHLAWLQTHQPGLAPLYRQLTLRILHRYHPDADWP